MERWATFDCYGTLIDWNGGIGRELERLFGAARGGELLGAYHELEPQIQRENPGRSYREVMATVLHSTIKVKVDGHRIPATEWIYRRFATVLPPDVASLAYALGFVLVWLGILLLLRRRRIYFTV